MKRFTSKRVGVVAAAALGLTMVGAVGGALTKQHDDSEVLVENEKAWAKAAVDGDADRMASYMADDYLELAWEPAGGNVPAHWRKTTKREWVEAVRSRRDVYSAVELYNLTVHLQGSLAVITGEYSQKGASSGRDISAAGIYANTWAKRNGRWVVMHSVFP